MCTYTHIQMTCIIYTDTYVRVHIPFVHWPTLRTVAPSCFKTVSIASDFIHDFSKLLISSIKSSHVSSLCLQFLVITFKELF